MGTTVGDGVVASTRVVGAVCGDRPDLYVVSDLAEKLGQHRRVTDVAPGNLDGTVSSVCSSTPMWILRQRRRFAPPCLRACHSPSPSALMQVLSIRRFSGPCEPR